jgi:hypothetical protein
MFLLSSPIGTCHTLVQGKHLTVFEFEFFFFLGASATRITAL